MKSLSYSYTNKVYFYVPFNNEKHTNKTELNLTYTEYFKFVQPDGSVGRATEG